jgi:hypothetical protein
MSVKNQGSIWQRLRSPGLPASRRRRLLVAEEPKDDTQVAASSRPR